jgi:glycosyltransferase involved in cell wall biosynthesis
VGEDTLGGAVHRQAEDLGLAGRVAFHGFLRQHTLRSLVSAADIHVVSSRHEADPIAMLEAAVAGVPTVGTAVGHVQAWSPEAAVAVPVADPAALAQAIEALLDDEPRRMRIARAAQARAIAEDADWTAAQVESIYAELTQRVRKGR